jgi:hypothetical protein
MKAFDTMAPKLTLERRIQLWAGIRMIQNLKNFGKRAAPMAERKETE